MTISFHDIWIAYADDVYRFAYWMTGNPTVAEDVLSETFVLAWTSPTPKEARTAKGYLLTIARNLCLKAIQRAGKTVPLDTIGEQGRGETAEGQCHSEELKEALALMQQLSEEERAALVLRAQDELTYEEVAEALEISIASAKVRVHRARVKLRELREKKREEYRK